MRSHTQKMQFNIAGMCCADETAQVEKALKRLDGILEVQTSLLTETVTIVYDPSILAHPDAVLSAIRKALQGAGCSAPLSLEPRSSGGQAKPYALEAFTHHVLALFGIVFGAVLFVVVAGEWLGLFAAIIEHVPWPLGLALVLVGGYPIFRNVIQAALKGRIISHTLMTVGALAALVVGDWATAAVVVFFMRIGDAAERFTTARARRAVKDLTAMAPQMARVERQGREQEVPVGKVEVGEAVIVRPGERLPVDGEVIGGQATVDQATITGESMPVEVGPGSHVFGATLACLGSLRVRATRVGRESTFGRIITMVEEAEAHRAEVQRLADRFSAHYLPVVVGIAALTLALRADPLATAAVLVVACSCSFALATPIALLASIGAAARRGLLIKGGKYLESLARADVLLIDKTGTLTFGRPQITDIIALDGTSETEVLRLAAAAERYSEHPLAEAVREAARQRQLPRELPARGEDRRREDLPGRRPYRDHGGRWGQRCARTGAGGCGHRDGSGRERCGD